MADGFVELQPDSTGKKVDTSELTRNDGSLVERQRVVIGDDYNPNSFLSIDSMVRVQRQLAELSTLEIYQESMNISTMKRHGERSFTIDRRGSIGRGTTR
jgi:hypothetical protein